MMGGGSIRGVVGQIKWSYYMAAAVNGYRVSRHADGSWSLAGTVVMSDPFKLSQRPLMFVAPHAKGQWEWPIVALDIAAGAVRAQLGAPLGAGSGPITVSKT